VTPDSREQASNLGQRGLVFVGLGPAAAMSGSVLREWIGSGRGSGSNSQLKEGAMGIAPATLGLSVLERRSGVARAVSCCGSRAANLVVEGGGGFEAAAWGGTEGLSSSSSSSRGEGREAVEAS
jgi:hypothetical protein